MTPVPSRPANTLRCALAAPAGAFSRTINELRGVAVCLVILQYAGGMLQWGPDFHFSLGLDMLFILTGMTLALDGSGAPAQGPPLGRILAEYWLILTAYALCNTHFLQLHYTPLNLAVHYLGIQGAFGDAYALAIDEPLCMVALIVAVTLLWRFCSSRAASPTRILLVGAVIAAPVAWLFHFYGQAASFTYLGQPLPGFLVGLLLGKLLRNGHVDFKLGPALGWALLVLVYLPLIQDILFSTTLAGFSLILAYAFGWKALAAAGLVKASSRVLNFIGQHWIEILLIHQPLIREYNYYLEGRWFGINPPTGTTLAAGIAIGLAATIAASMVLRRLLRKIPSLLPSTP